MLIISNVITRSTYHCVLVGISSKLFGQRHSYLSTIPQCRDKQYGHSALQHGALSLCSLLAANSQISVLIGQKMQFTGFDYGNDMRNAICVHETIIKLDQNSGVM